MRKRSTAPWLVALLLAAGICLAFVLEQRLERGSVIWFFAGGAALVVVLGWFAPGYPQAAAEPQPLSRIGATLAFASAAFFRMRYLWTIPAGYGFEPLTFVFFARRLYLEGFPYIPYAWYAHTFYSYAIAALLPFIDNELVAARLAALIISLLTVAAFYFCARALFGRQVGWIAVALLAPSWWHLFASRNGYHQFAMPLFHSLFLGGVVVGLRDGKWWGFYLAGFALVGALHAYWGLYLLLPYIALLGLYVLLFQRACLHGRLLHLSLATGATLAALAPLIKFFADNMNLFGYTTRAFAPQMSDAPDVLSKLANNGWYVLGALSGQVGAQVPYGSVVDPLVGAAALVGIALSLRWWRVSLAHMAVLLLFVVNVAGLLATMANYFYVTATMAAMYLLAAVALGELLSSAGIAVGRFRVLCVMAMMALLAWRTIDDYDTFFRRRLLVDLQSPFKPIGRAYQILENVAELLPTSTVYIARDEPGRDFADEIFELGVRLPSCGFMGSVQPLDAASVLFPAQRLTPQRKLELIVPNEPYVERRLIPMLRRVYPGLTVAPQLAPEPFQSLDARPIAIHIAVPWQDLERRFGLTGGSQNEGSGLFFAPNDGAYRFRITGEPGKQMHLHGRPTQDGEQVLLERGLHPVRIVGWNQGEIGVDFQFGDGAWTAIDGLIVNTTGVDEREIEPYLARPGRIADFFFEYAARLEVGHTIRDAPVDASGEVAAVMINAVEMLGPLGAPRWKMPLTGPRDYRGLFHDGRLLVVGPGGEIVTASVAGPAAHVGSPCGLRDIAARAGQLVALCDSSIAVIETPSSPVPLRGPDHAPLLLPVAMRARDDILFVADAGASELLAYDKQAQLRNRWVVPNLWGESELAIDAAKNLYLKRWRFGWRAYAPDGALLFHPTTLKPLLFSRNGESLENIGLRRLQMAENHATLVSPDGHIDVYERRPVAAPSAAR